jgi:hypothetical protein
MAARLPGPGRLHPARDGEPVEDALHDRARLRRERAEREAAYFGRLANEAHSEGKAVDEIRYRGIAAKFREEG